VKNDTYIPCKFCTLPAYRAAYLQSENYGLWHTDTFLIIVVYNLPGRSRKFDKFDQVKPLEYVTLTDAHRFVFEDFIADIIYTRIYAKYLE
jgi:hypothetical protein